MNFLCKLIFKIKDKQITVFLFMIHAEHMVKKEKHNSRDGKQDILKRLKWCSFLLFSATFISYFGIFETVGLNNVWTLSTKIQFVTIPLSFEQMKCSIIRKVFPIISFCLEWNTTNGWPWINRSWLK